MIWNGGKREAKSKGRNAKSFNDKDDNIILHSKNYQIIKTRKNEF